MYKRQEVAFLLAFIGFPHADDAARPAAWCPDHDDQPAIQFADCDVTWLCVFPVSYTHLDVYKRQVYIFGSRSRGDYRWNSDFDFWVDADVAREKILEIEEQLEESIVPFGVDLVCTSQLQGEFGKRVIQEAKRWM